MEKFYSWTRQLKITGKLPTKDQINSVFMTFSKKEWIIFNKDDKENVEFVNHITYKESKESSNIYTI